MNIEQAKDVYEGLKRNEHIVESIDREFFFRFADTVLNELEKKDKVIDEMADYMSFLDVDEDICKNTEHCTYGKKLCKDCIKEYFYKKTQKQ